MNYVYAVLSLYTTRSVATCEVLNLFLAHKVEVARYGVLQC